MFMVASSVVTTIMILNYHHRLSDTHKMPNWVGADVSDQLFFKSISPGADPVPSVDPLAVEDVSARRKDHQEDHPDPEQDEGDGYEGELLQVPPGERP